MDDRKYWQEKHTKYSQQDWIVKPTIFATQVVKYFPEKGKVLDLGAGQGQDSGFFAERGYDVLAADFSEFALDRAKERLTQKFGNKVTFKNLDLSKKLPFKECTFDIVYSHLALHYFDAARTKELFGEIYKVLKPGGVFATLLNTIDDPEISSSKKIEDGLYITPSGLQKRFFSVAEVSDLTRGYKTLLLDNHGETHKDEIKTLVRYVGRKP